MVCVGDGLMMVGKRNNNKGRKKLAHLVSSLARLKGITDLSLTTNGTLLAKYAEELAEAGTLIDETGYRRRDPELLIATARLNLLDGDRDAARQTLAQAKAKVEEMGYHSLDHELAELDERLR